MKLKQTLFQILGIVILLFLFWLIKRILGSPRNSFKEFFIDSKTNLYNLAKIQAFLWAFVIMAFIITNYLIIIFKDSLGIHIEMSAYQINFPEQILWLLGLSLTSYITIKGITDKYESETEPDNSINDRIISREVSSNNVGLSNLISDNFGKFDFSKFQMLIWTILALSIYLISCNNFYFKLMDIKRAEFVEELFMVPEDKVEYKKSKLSTLEFEIKNLKKKNDEIEIKKSQLKIEIEEALEVIDTTEEFVVQPQTSQIESLNKEKENNEISIKKLEEKENYVRRLQDTDEIPNISTSLLILMGLSQGAYIANKLRIDNNQKKENSM